jgi:stage II sporulation protein D
MPAPRAGARATRQGEAPGGAAVAAGPLRLDREPAVDVGLAWDLDSLTLGFEPGARFQLEGRDGASDGGRAGATCVFSAGSSVMRVRSQHRSFTTNDTVFCPAGESFRWSYGGKSWRGSPRVFLNPRGKLTLATRVPLESYLKGVVPGEIGGLGETDLEAGKAQAIAARSYTMFYRGRRAAEGFDLYGTVEDQVYGGVGSERPLATRAVESTRGTFVLDQGRPIRANYCGNCGGISAEVWEAWPAEALAYLPSQPDGGGEDWCSRSPNYRWQEQWTPAELAANLTRFAPLQGVPLPPGGVGEIVNVRADARSRSGRVWRLVITTTKGEIVIPAYAIRQVLRRGGSPGSLLRSNLFKVDVRRDPETRRATAVVASGGGSGHGVGLCQSGALGMARAGRDAVAILAHYYPGTTLERLY